MTILAVIVTAVFATQIYLLYIKCTGDSMSWGITLLPLIVTVTVVYGIPVLLYFIDKLINLCKNAKSK